MKHTTHPHRSDSPFPTGFSLLSDPALNKGTAFTQAEQKTRSKTWLPNYEGFA
jgi:hypothetical protein